MHWLGAPNPLWLAAGFDRDGTRAGELLTLGFGGVDFGTVTPHPAGDRFPAAAELAARLAPFAARRADDDGRRTRIGANLGIMPGQALAPDRDWSAGIAACARLVDCLTLNLSGEAARPLLADDAAAMLAQGLAAARREIGLQAAASGHRPALAIKLPIGEVGRRLPELLRTAAPDALLCVLDDGDERPLAALAARNAACGRNAPALLAVGGIASAADLRRVIAAGAAAVQVYAAFDRRGAACINELLDNDKGATAVAARPAIPATPDQEIATP